ncbi:MAG TPA: MFS transporter [Chloroflexota bacterium]|nr:MFS transporter [Chloroflexota bacterium]
MGEPRPPRDAAAPRPAEPVMGAVGGPIGLLARWSTFEAFQFREFRLLWLGQLGSAMGQWMDQVTRGWLMYDLTGSALQLGLVSAIRFFPILLLSPLAGTAADRYGRKTQLIADQLTNATLNFILATLVITRHVQPWHVYVTGFLVAVLQVFQQPARLAMVPESVDRAHLTNAIGLNSIAFNSSRSLGPAISGAIVAAVGPGGSYIVQGLIYVFASQWTAQLRLPNKPTHARSSTQTSSMAAATLEGWRYIIRDPIIRSGMMISYVQALMGVPFATLLPVFARDILMVGPEGQGLLLTTMGFGALGTAFLIAAVGDRLPKGWMLVGGIMTYGVGLLVFSQSLVFGLSLAAMVVVGSSGVTAGALVQTVLQAHSPPPLRGRIMGVFQQAQIMSTVGGLLTGSFATLFGAQRTVEGMGVALAACSALIFLTMPSIRDIR